MIEVAAGLIGEPVDQGRLTVTREQIRSYAAVVGDHDTLAGDCSVAPPTFVLSMRRGMTPHIELPAGVFGVFGGHDLVFHDVIRAGQAYRISSCVTDVFEKSGRSGPLTVVVRTATIATEAGEPVVEIVEQQIVRPGPPPAGGGGE